MRILTFLFKLPTRLLFGGIILLAVVALGIGWGANALRDRGTEPPPTPTGEPAAPLTAPPTATTQALPTQSPEPPADTPPTSTPVPSPTPSPPGPAEEGWEIVQPGEGLYMVCRRHCPARWPPDDADLEAYARQVAQLNGLSWPDPALSLEQRLRMPPCPE